MNLDFSELHDGFKLNALLMAPAQAQFQTLHILKDFFGVYLRGFFWKVQCAPILMCCLCIYVWGCLLVCISKHLLRSKLGFRPWQLVYLRNSSNIYKPAMINKLKRLRMDISTPQDIHLAVSGRLTVCTFF